MRRILLSLLVWPLLAIAATAGPAEDRLRALFARPAQADLFADSFLAIASVAEVEAVLAPIRARIGPVREVQVADGDARIVTATHVVDARIALDDAGRITTVFVDPPTARSRTLETALDGLLPLARDVAWLVRRDGAVLAMRRADRALPVASAFKLAVLALLKRDIDAGRRDWADVVKLHQRHVSLPSGLLQNVPPGSPLTLHTAALLMIARSDNTATDLLIDVLDADRIAPLLGLDVLPTTRAVFAEMADAPAGTLPRIADVANVQSDAWAVPLTILCDLLDEVADLPLFTVDPGPVTGDWTGVAYKGGSLHGTLALTAHLTADGSRTCIALSLNDAGPLDQPAIIAAFRAAIAALAR